MIDFIAEMIVSATERLRILRTDVDTLSPGFETFMTQYDSGEWITIPTPGFEWTLHGGLNTRGV